MFPPEGQREGAPLPGRSLLRQRSDPCLVRCLLSHQSFVSICLAKKLVGTGDLWLVNIVLGRAGEEYIFVRQSRNSGYFNLYCQFSILRRGASVSPGVATSNSLRHISISQQLTLRPEPSGSRLRKSNNSAQACTERRRLQSFLLSDQQFCPVINSQSKSCGDTLIPTKTFNVTRLEIL